MDVLFGGVNHIDAGADILGAQSTFSGDTEKVTTPSHQEHSEYVSKSEVDSRVNKV